MPAGGAERIAGGDDARADRIAVADRLREADVVAIARADVAHRGEARVEHGAGIADRAHRPEAVGIFEPAIAADVGRAVEVDVHVDQPGDERPAGEVDVAHVAAPAHGARIGDAGDAAVVADEDRGLLDIAPGGDVEIAVGGDDRFLGGGGRGERDQRSGGEQDAHGLVPFLGHPNAAAPLV